MLIRTIPVPLPRPVDPGERRREWHPGLIPVAPGSSDPPWRRAGARTSEAQAQAEEGTPGPGQAARWNAALTQTPSGSGGGWKRNQPGCACCTCGTICIVVCNGSVVTLTYPDLSTQVQTATADNQTVCFTIGSAGTYTIQVTHSRLQTFSSTFNATCTVNNVPYTPVAASGYHFFCGGCCQPIKTTLHYSDGTNIFTLNYVAANSLGLTDGAGHVFAGWEGCGPLLFGGGGGGSCCLATTSCGDAPDSCFSTGTNCCGNCVANVPVLGYVLLVPDTCCDIWIYALQCPNPGACGNTCWVRYGGQACAPGTSYVYPPPPTCGSNPVPAWQQVGLGHFSPSGTCFPVHDSVISCPPAFSAYDPLGALGGCFGTSGGITVTE